MSIYDSALTKALTEIRTLDTKVTPVADIRRLDWDNVQKIKGIQVCWSRPQTRTVVSDREDRGYPVHVVMVKGGKTSMSTDTDFHLEFFEKVRRHFNNKRVFSGVADAGSALLPSMVTEGRVPASIAKTHDVQHLIVWCWIRETRTNA